MRSFEVPLRGGCDPTHALSQTTTHMPSVHADPTTWDGILGALKAGNVPALAEKAEALVVRAVPEEGDPHPQRARWWTESDHAVAFQTPGGVTLCVDAEGEEVLLMVDFNRESTYLATSILSALFVLSGGFKEPIPGVAQLLAQAAAEAAGEEEG